MQTKTFRGGVHPDASKLSAHVALQRLALPSEVTISLKQHIGADIMPIVKVGDQVRMGQKIADNSSGLCVPAHASVSGRVVSIGLVDSSSGARLPAITIANDGNDTPDDSIEPYSDWETASPETLKNIIREGGIVGMGGAGFPTYAKLQTPPGKRLSVIIINGAECEPYLTCMHRLLLEQPEVIITGIKVLMRAASVDRVYIGVKVTMDGVQDALRPYLEKEKGIDLVLLESKYPQGEERQLIYAVTGQEVPSGGLPWDVGALVISAATTWAVGNLINTGMPSIERAMTVTGAVQQPGNFHVRVGVSLQNLIEAAGGFAGQPGMIILGGPMTGLPQTSLKIPLTKRDNGIVVIARDKMDSFVETDCIHCGKCVTACPYRLMPLYLAKESQRGDVEQMKRFNILDCRECGSCAYVCPAKIPLLHWMKLGKGLLRASRI